MSDSLQPHGLQHAGLLCPSPTPGACSNSCPSSQWCHPTISSSVVPFSHFQSFSASRSFPMSQLFTSDCQISKLQLQHQTFQWIFRTDFLGLPGMISLLSRDSQRVFSNTTVQKQPFSSFLYGSNLTSIRTTGKTTALTTGTIFW